jgi:hypothetical protein
LLLACLVVAAVSPVCAGTPERDKAWSELIAQAKAHGGEETKLDRSASYVFQREDGSYLTITELFSPAKARSVCLIDKEETATACVDWDSGKLKLGKRADAATPWTFYAFESVEALRAAQPTVIDKFLNKAWSVVKLFGNPALVVGDKCMYIGSNGLFRHADKMNCE